MFQVLCADYHTSGKALVAAQSLQDDLATRVTELHSNMTDDKTDNGQTDRASTDNLEKDETKNTTPRCRSTRGGRKDETSKAKSEEGQYSAEPLGLYGGSGKREILQVHQALPWER